MQSILVLDDDPAICQLVSLVLRSEGIEVATANNGDDGLELLQARRPHLIILDLQMPKMDGPTFNAEARRAGYDGPVVILSAAPDVEPVRRQLGAAACITKPFEPEKLVSTVKSLLVA